MAECGSGVPGPGCALRGIPSQTRAEHIKVIKHDFRFSQKSHAERSGKQRQMMAIRGEEDDHTNNSKKGETSVENNQR